MKLSIIIPVYNVGKYIKKTINSLTIQNKNQFEIIIVNDGSTDNTSNVIEKIIKEDNLKNCKVIEKTNGGVSSARNKGMYEASGKYIMFLDGDDYVSLDLIENIYNNIDKKESDIICWGCNTVDENSITLKSYFDIYNLRYENMTGIETLNNMFYYKKMWIYTGSAIYRKEFLLQYNLNYTEGCVNGEDQEFTIKALARASEVVFINKSLSYYVQRGTSISNSYNIKRFDVIDAMNRLCQYLDRIGNDELKKISNIIRNEYITNNYIENIDCCLHCLYLKEGLEKSAYSILYDDMKQNYPELNKQMTYIMKNYNSSNVKMWFKVKILLISPQMYTYIFGVNNKTKKIRKGLENILNIKYCTKT